MAEIRGARRGDAAPPEEQPAQQPAQQRQPTRAERRLGFTGDALDDPLAGAEELYEVMVDTLGANPTFIRGDLVTGDELRAANYQVEPWLLRYGHIRPAPEYARTSFISSTQPTTESGRLTTLPSAELARLRARGVTGLAGERIPVGVAYDVPPRQTGPDTGDPQNTAVIAAQPEPPGEHLPNVPNGDSGLVAAPAQSTF